MISWIKPLTRLKSSVGMWGQREQKKNELAFTRVNGRVKGPGECRVLVTPLDVFPLCCFKKEYADDVRVVLQGLMAGPAYSSSCFVYSGSYISINTHLSTRHTCTISYCVTVLDNRRNHTYRASAPRALPLQPPNTGALILMLPWRILIDWAQTLLRLLTKK